MTSRIQMAIVATALVASAPLPLSAQLIRVPKPADATREISANLHVGNFQTAGRFDESGELWSFGEGFQYRGSLDVALRSGSLGLTGSVVTVPVLRNGGTDGRGDMQFRQVMGTFRSPDGDGFHQVLELSAGLAQWGNYSGSGTLADPSPRNAFTFVIGYGFGFGLGERARLSVVQDAASVIGPSKGLPDGARRTQAQYTTRIGLRYRIVGGR